MSSAHTKAIQNAFDSIAGSAVEEGAPPPGAFLQGLVHHDERTATSASLHAHPLDLDQEMSVLTALPNAVRRGEVSAMFQPIVRKGTVVSFEGLARWTSVWLGNVGPSVFIPAADYLGVISDIDDLVLDRSLEAASMLPGIEASVNISAKSLQTPDFIGKIERALEAHSVPHAQLAIELTESAIAANETHAKQMIADLKGRGIKVVLDDFGVGYSSMNYLKAFHFDAIKFDRSFTTDLDDNSLDVIEGIVALARYLNVTVIAKGVQTYSQAGLLASAGIEDMQGHYFGRPADLAPFIVYARRRHDVPIALRAGALAPKWHRSARTLKRILFRTL